MDTQNGLTFQTLFTPNFPAFNWSQMGTNLAGGAGGLLGSYLGLALGTAIGGENNQVTSGALSNLGSYIGTNMANNLATGQNMFSNINWNNVGNMGSLIIGNAAGQAIGNSIGGTNGARIGKGIGTAISNTYGLTSTIIDLANNSKNAIKGIEAAKNALKTGTDVIKAGSDVAKLGKAANWMNIAGTVASIGDSFLEDKQEYAGDKGKITKGLDTAYDVIQTGVSFIPGVGQIAGGAMALADLTGDLLHNYTNAYTDGMTTTDAILGSSFFSWTPMGIINGAAGLTMGNYDMDRELYGSVGSSYEGSLANAEEGEHKSGKRYGLLSRKASKEATQLINKAIVDQNRLTPMARNALLAKDRVATMTNENRMNIRNKLRGDLDFNQIREGKLGMKIIKAKKTLMYKNGSKIEEIDSWLPDWDSWMPDTWDSWVPDTWINSVESFKEGGKMNVIPEGALHARLHHMDNDENITKKGIPVVSETEDGNIILLAEIEKNEIIFNLDVTKKLEKLAKEGTDKAAIEAGKLLATEILENTEDRTGLILDIE